MVLAIIRQEISELEQKVAEAQTRYKENIMKPERKDQISAIPQVPMHTGYVVACVVALTITMIYTICDKVYQLILSL